LQRALDALRARLVALLPADAKLLLRLERELDEQRRRDGRRMAPGAPLCF
jgi:hypothetical protein